MHHTPSTRAVRPSSHDPAGSEAAITSGRKTERSPWAIHFSGKTAATVTPVALVLQFISGVFFQFNQVPTWLQTVAALFPLKWMAQGLRSVFLPDALAAEEPAGSWELGRVALVLAIWCVVGLLLCVRTFTWQDRTDR